MSLLGREGYLTVFKRGFCLRFQFQTSSQALSTLWRLGCERGRVVRPLAPGRFSVLPADPTVPRSQRAKVAIIEGSPGLGMVTTTILAAPGRGRGLGWTGQPSLDHHDHRRPLSPRYPYSLPTTKYKCPISPSVRAWRGPPRRPREVWQGAWWGVVAKAAVWWCCWYPPNRPCTS